MWERCSTLPAAPSLQAMLTVSMTLSPEPAGGRDLGELEVTPPQGKEGGVEFILGVRGCDEVDGRLAPVLRGEGWVRWESLWKERP